MNEREEARSTAERWLNMRINKITDLYEDPDCDGLVLARQYMRALDKIEQLTEILQLARKHLADVWPKAVQ